MRVSNDSLDVKRPRPWQSAILPVATGDNIGLKSPDLKIRAPDRAGLFTTVGRWDGGTDAEHGGTVARWAVQTGSPEIDVLFCSPGSPGFDQSG